MRYGYIDTYIAKVLLFGIAGSGKTSVTAIMTGEDPPQKRESTSLMARPVQVTAILIDDELEWEKKTPEEVRKKIAEIIRSRKLLVLTVPTDQQPEKDLEPDSETDPEPDLDSTSSVSKNPESHKTDPESTSQKTNLESTASESTDLKSREMDSHNYRGDQPHSAQIQRMDPTPPPKSKSEFDRFLEETVEEDDFLLQVHNSNPSTEPILEQRWLYIIDSGGQPEFHNMLSVFVQNTTACIFVFRMHDDLDDNPLVYFYKDGSSVGSSQRSRLTNGQIFQQFMCTMRSFKSMKNEVPPPSILLLATHRDLVEGGELPKPLLDGLKAIVLPQFKGQLIYYKQLKNFVFTMNAKQPEKKDRETANQIQKLITEQCPGEKVKIPLRWHNLDHQSRKISDHLNRKVLTREEYGKIAKKLNIDDKSCEEALEFFNSLNTIFYLPKVLPDVVFLEPQILLNLLNELVTKKYRADQGAKMPKKSDLHFHEVAQVTKELLEEFKEHYHPPLFTSQELAKLFEKLLIFGKLGEGKWFVPSILPSLKSEEVDQHHVSKERALLIHFPDGGPQNGIFCSTVSFLLSADNNSPSHWEVLKDRGEPKCLTRNVISFTVGEFPGKVTLIEEWTHLEVHIKNSDPEVEDDLWKRVYDTVFRGLEKATEAHHYSNTVNVPQPAIRCPEQDIHHPSTPHPATINRKGKWMCTQCQEYGGQVTETIPWLKLLPPGKFVCVCVCVCVCVQ